MEENNETAARPTATDRAMQILLIEAVCVLILLAGVMAIKFFWKETFTDLADWYGQNICADTDVQEVLEPPENSDAV